MVGRFSHLALVGAACLGVLGGCRKAEPAPSELNDLARYLFREFEDPEALAEGLLNLETHFATVDFEANSVRDRSWVLESLQPADVEGLTVPADRNVTDCAAVGIAYQSPHRLARHAEYVRPNTGTCQLAVRSAPPT